MLPRSIKGILRRFKQHLTVSTWQGRRRDQPAQTIMTEEMDRRLIKLVTELDDESMLLEIHEEFMLRQPRR